MGVGRTAVLLGGAVNGALQPKEDEQHRLRDGVEGVYHVPRVSLAEVREAEVAQLGGLGDEVLECAGGDEDPAEQHEARLVDLRARVVELQQSTEAPVLAREGAEVEGGRGEQVEEEQGELALEGAQAEDAPLELEEQELPSAGVCWQGLKSGLQLA